MNTRIQKENDQVWLESVQGWAPGEKGSSVHAAQEAILQSLGEDMDYHTLLGVSGLAFRMQVSKDGLCPSSPHSFCGYHCVQRSVQALPWEIEVYEVYKIKPDNSEGVAKVRLAVKESIDRGVPVQYGSEEDGLIVGYQKDGQEWLVLHPYKENGKTMVVETDLPWGIAVFTKPKEILTDPFGLGVEAIQQAVKMAYEKECDGYSLGFAAWEEYNTKLTALLNASNEVRQENMLGNAWIYECLIQYRRSAAIYLRRLAADFPGMGASYLHKAASGYEKMVNRILCDQENCFTAIAPYPWMLKDGETWSQEQIGDQIKRLKEACLLEREVIADLQQALALHETSETIKS